VTKSGEAAGDLVGVALVLGRVSVMLLDLKTSFRWTWSVLRPCTLGCCAWKSAWLVHAAIIAGCHRFRDVAAAAAAAVRTVLVCTDSLESQWYHLQRQQPEKKSKSAANLYHAR